MSSAKYTRKPILKLVKELSDGLPYASLLERTLKDGAMVNASLGPVFLDEMREVGMKEAVQLDLEKKNNGGADLLLPFLAGIPISIKDNFCVKDSKTTAGSKMLQEFTSPYDATVVEKLKLSRAIPCLKANLDEFGMGSSMSNSAFGPCLNPWGNVGGRRLTAGGSSGASAVAVATGVVAGAIGSDTGGSVRQPASFCGVVGFKPSYGACSRHGLISYASSMDTPGIITGNVLDSMLLFDSIRGYDRRDSTSSSDSDSGNSMFKNSLRQNIGSLESIMAYADEKSDVASLKGTVIGIPQEFIVDELDALSLSSLHKTIRRLESCGVEFRTVSIPSLKYALPCYYVIACAEASSNLSRYDGIRYGKRHHDVAEDLLSSSSHATNLHKMISASRTKGFGPEVIKRILTGCYVLSEGAFNEYYGVAHSIRQDLKREMSDTFKSGGIDLLMSLSAPVLPFSLDQPPDPATTLINDFLTVPANLTACPAISIPVDVVSRKVDGNSNSNSGINSDSSNRSSSNSIIIETLPVGVQLIGAYNQDAKLLNLALAIEKAINFKI